MRLFVINRRIDIERRTRSREQLEDRNIPFEFFEAMSGTAAIDARVFEAIDDDEFMLNTGRTAAPGEIGCFASHRRLWQLAVQTDEAIMIMEDDFDLLDHFRDAYRSAAAAIGKIGFLRLQAEESARKRPLGSCDGFRVSRYTKAPHCTMCYCIAPQVARRFVNQSQVCGAPVDVFIRNFWGHGEPLFALTPYAVAPSVTSVLSTIGLRDHSSKRPGAALRRALRKGIGYWRRWQFNVRHRYSTDGDPRVSRRLAAPRVRDSLDGRPIRAGDLDDVETPECGYS